MNSVLQRQSKHQESAEKNREESKEKQSVPEQPIKNPKTEEERAVNALFDNIQRIKTVSKRNFIILN